MTIYNSDATFTIYPVQEIIQCTYLTQALLEKYPHLFFSFIPAANNPPFFWFLLGATVTFPLVFHPQTQVTYIAVYKTYILMHPFNVTSSPCTMKFLHTFYAPMLQQTPLSGTDVIRGTPGGSVRVVLST
jgi:hypothetical protein